MAQVDDDDVLVKQFMSRVAQVSSAVPHMPSSQLLWCKARLLREWEAERKRTLPLDILEPVQIAMTVAAAALLVARALPLVMQALGLG